MKFVNLAIGSILFLEAFALLYAPTEKYNFHSFVALLKNQWQDCPWFQTVSFSCIEQMRLFVVAIIFTGALSLQFCNGTLIGLVAQLIWTITQSQSYYSTGMAETRNTLTQILLTVVLLQSIFRQCKKSQQLTTSKQSNFESEAQPLRKASQKLKQESFQTKKESKSQPSTKKQQQQKSTQSPQKSKPKSSKKK